MNKQIRDLPEGTLFMIETNSYRIFMLVQSDDESETAIVRSVLQYNHTKFGGIWEIDREALNIEMDKIIRTMKPSRIEMEYWQA